MGRFWSLLFLLVPVLGVGIFVWAAADIWPLRNHWLPEDISEHGIAIDSLFDFIMYLTGVIFIITGLAMFIFLWKYDAASNAKPVQFVHGNHVLEIVWSILPAAILLFIALYQLEPWSANKLARPSLPGPDGVLHTDDDLPMLPIAEVTGRQFEWRIRYAGKDGVIGTPDDLHTVNDLRLPIDQEIVLAIKSQDVLHSFFLPNFRVKQDVVPGMKQHVWFTATKTGAYDIVCAELCGWGHYKMKGRITIEHRDDYDQWIKDLESSQNLTELASR